jgi:tyrosinase
LFLLEYELQACGYTGGQPYWDWTLDTDSEKAFLSSPVFDTARGFGGNGQYVPADQLTPAPTMFIERPKLIANRTGGGCLVDGPFAGLSTELGPRDNIQMQGRHCVTRDLAYAYMRNTTDTDLVQTAMEFPTFGLYGNRTEYSYHAGGHWAIGGEYATMSDMWVSRKSTNDVVIRL